MSDLTDYKRRNRARYEGHSEAEKYERSRAKRLYSVRIARWVSSKLTPDDRILDIGGGVGYQAHLMRTWVPGFRCIAIDLAWSPLRERARKHGMTLNVQGDMEYLPFSDATFDVACFFGALHHSQYPLKVLSEVRRILTASGSILLVEPVSLSLRLSARGFDSVGDGVNFRFSLPFLTRQLRIAGFTVREVRTTRIFSRILGSWPRRFDALVRLGVALDSMFLERLPFVGQLGATGLVWGRAI